MYDNEEIKKTLLKTSSLIIDKNFNDGSNRYQGDFPSKKIISDLTHDIMAVLFPKFFSNSNLKSQDLESFLSVSLDSIEYNLRNEIQKSFCLKEANNLDENYSKLSEQKTRSFMEKLPVIQSTLLKDCWAAYNGDPAASSVEEAILSYPGIIAICMYRIAHELYSLGVPYIPRIITESSHSITGIDIHPGASIGESFFIDHGTGVVIGETTIIGNNVKIYQGVTLGAKSFSLDSNGFPVKNIDRHPIVEDDVTIYAEATILGRITIGKGSVIGANTWVTEDVAPNSVIYK